MTLQSSPRALGLGASLFLGIALLAWTGGSHPAAADGKNYPPVKDPLVVKECGACHMTYSAAFLRAGTWKRIVDGLQDHFGENASLDPVVAGQVLAYLTANAEREPKGVKKLLDNVVAPVEQPLRISEQRWFKGEHPPRRFTAGCRRGPSPAL